eukprot:m.48500 g.48500  ORF g.48500 m.48500 type:complete len:416 (+) comp14963_c0_seq1:254-1501(+)
MSPARHTVPRTSHATRNSFRKDASKTSNHSADRGHAEPSPIKKSPSGSKSFGSGTKAKNMQIFIIDMTKGKVKASSVGTKVVYSRSEVTSMPALLDVVCRSLGLDSTLQYELTAMEGMPVQGVQQLQNGRVYSLSKPSQLPALSSSDDDGSADDFVFSLLLREVMAEILDIAIVECYEEIRRFYEDVMRRAHQKYTQESKPREPELCRVYDEYVDTILGFMMQPRTESGPIAERDAIDAVVRGTFFDVTVAALRGLLTHWERLPKMFVALVILLDQFPRRIFRGTADSYVGEAHAQQVILRALRTGVFHRVPPVHRIFPCLALSHIENLEMQQLASREWDKVCHQFASTDPIWKLATAFETNRHLIERFGRFPDRNEVLLRESTPEELAYLNNVEDTQPKPSFLTTLSRKLSFHK